MVGIIYRALLTERALLALCVLAAVAVSCGELGRRSWPGAGRHFSKNHPPPRRPPPVPIPETFTRWRRDFQEANAASDRLGLVRGIFLGDSPAVEEKTRELFRVAGLAHFLAADGFKCWMTASAFGFFLQAGLLLLLPFLPSRAFLSAKARAEPAARLIGAWLFWLWSDQSAAVTRAATMISELLVIRLAGLSVSFPRLLLVQYLASLCVLPRLWHSPSFQLSFGCIFGLILVPRAVRPLKPHGRLAGAVWEHFFSSLGACVGALPTDWIMFGEINFTGVHTHWFSTPVICVALMPLALAQMLLLAPGLELAATPAGAFGVGALGTAAAWVSTRLEQVLRLWLEHVPVLRP
jgi:predicted membrane metal-binding protein